MSPPKRRGRPPNQLAQATILKAAHDILTEDGFGRLTVEAVAARSGVGKPTIYRHWANASELAMAALMSGDPGIFAEGGTSLRSALAGQMRSLIQAFATTRGRQIAMTLAAADPESEFTKAFRNQVILSSREAGRAMLLEAAARGGDHVAARPRGAARHDLRSRLLPAARRASPTRHGLCRQHRRDRPGSSGSQPAKLENESGP